MKKTIVFIVAVLYLSSSAGITVHFHYCMGKLINWGLLNKDSDKCGKCGMEKGTKKKNDCCKDEHKYVKNISDQKTAEQAIQLMQVLTVATPSAFIQTSENYSSFLTEGNLFGHAPPRSSSTSVYIRNCVFRI